MVLNNITDPTSKEVGLIGLGEIDPKTNLAKGNSTTVALTPISGYSDLVQTTQGRTPKSYQRILGDEYHPEFPGRVTQSRLAANQSSGGQFLGLLNQGIMGEVVGGTIEGFGYLTDLRGTSMLEDDGEKSFGEALVDVGKAYKTWAEETSPIYVDPDQQTFAPGHWSWWMKNGTSVFSTLSLMIPSGAVVKGASMAGKLLGLSAKLGSKTGKALSVVGQATVSRHMENMMEASGVYEETFNRSMNEGMSKEDATKKASLAASKTYSADWAMLGMDIAQYALLANKLGKGRSESTPGMDKLLGGDKTKRILSQGEKYAGTALGEGVEEGYQWFASEAGKFAAEKAFDPTIKESFGDRVGGYLESGELWTNIVFGAIGGAGFKAVGDNMFKGGDHQVEEIKQLGTSFKAAYDKLKMAEQLKDVPMADEAKAELRSMIGVRAASKGMLDQSVQFFEKVAKGEFSPEELQKLNIDPETIQDLKADDIEKSKKDIIAAGEKYIQTYERILDTKSPLNKSLRKLYDSRPKDMKNISIENYARSYASLLSRSEFQLEQLNETRLRLEKEKNEAESKIVNFNMLSPSAQNIFLVKARVDALTKQKEMINKQLEGKEINEKHKRDIDASTKILDFILGTHEKNLKELEENYTKEDKANDKNINIDSPAIEDFHAKEALLSRVTGQIASWQSAIDRYKKGEISTDDARTNYDKELDELEEDTKEYTPETDDIVTWLDDMDGEHYGIVEKIDPNDPEKYAVQEINENYKQVGKVQIKNKIDLSLVDKLGDLDIERTTVEVVSHEELTNEKKYQEELENSGLNAALSDLANSMSMSNIDLSRPDKIDIRDKELDTYLSNPTKDKEELKTAVATFTIDFENKFWDDVKDDNVRKLRLKAKAGKLTAKDIDTITTVSKGNEEVFSKEALDKLPISISINIGGKVYDKGLYLHDSDFWNVRAPLSYEGNPETFILEQRQNTRSIRKEIITNLLLGNKVTTTNLNKLRGWFNTTKDYGNLHDRLGVKSGELKLYIGTGGIGEKAFLQSSATDIVAKFNPSRGGVYITTNKTCDGGEVLVRASISKLSTDHAEILWKAIFTRYFKGKGRKAKIEDSRVEGVTAGDVINILSLFGDRATNPNHPNNKSMSEYLAEKALFVRHEGGKTFLYFGKNNKVDLFDTNPERAEQNMLDFIEWATKNKNYRIPLSNKSMSLQLNSPYKKKFKIGSLVNDGKQNYSAILIDTVVGTTKDGKPIYMLSTNVDRVTNPVDGSKIESITHSPLLDVNVRSLSVAAPKVETPITETPTQPKATTTPDVNIDELKKLEVGTNIYYVDNSDKNVIFGIVRVGTNGIKYIELTNGFQELNAIKGKNNVRLVKGNQSLINELYNFILQGSKKIDYETPRKPDDTTDTGDESLDDIVVGKEAYVIAPGTRIISERELDWVYAKFGKINIKHTDKLIQIAEQKGKLFFGAFMSDAISIYKAAPGEVLYHEAFHRVSLGYLSPLDRERVYNEAKERYGLKSLNNAQIEEFLANQFMLYKTKGIKTPRRGFVEYVKDLYDFIKTVFTGETRLRSYDMTKLFESIDRGKFRYSKISKANLEALRGKAYGYEIGGVDIPTIGTVEEMNDLVKGLAAVLIDQNKVTNLNDTIRNLDFSKLTAYIKNLIPRFVTVRNKTITKLSVTGLDEATKSKLNEDLKELDHLIALYESIMTKQYLPTIYSRINTALLSYNIKIKEEEKDEEVILDDTNNDYDTDKYLANIHKAQYEVSTKDNVMASIKFLIATLPASEKINRLTRTTIHVDFNETWSMLLFDLWNKDSIKEMLDVLDEKSHIYPYKKLAEKLRAGDDILRIQFKVSMNKHKHMFINFLFNLDDNKKPTFEVSKADTFSAAKIERMAWNEYLYETDIVDKTQKRPNIDIKVVDSILNEYNSIITKFSKQYSKDASFSNDETTSTVIREVIPILNKMGIDVDQTVISEYVNKRSKDLNITKSEALNLFLLQDLLNVIKRLKDPELNDPIKIRRVYSDEKLIKVLSELKYEVYPDLINDSILGPGNNMYFTYSQNNYLTDLIRKFNKDKEVINRKLEKTANRNSSFLSQMLNDDVRKGVKLATFSAAVQTDIGDSGRDYLSLNSIEDYLIKMFAFEKGYIAFPTLADKRSYFFLEGLQAIDFNLEFAEDGSYTIPDEVIDLFVGYAKDERDRIAQVKLTLENYSTETDPVVKAEKEKSLINNYHYIKRGENPIDITKANGLLYHSFPSFNNKDFDFDRDARESIKQTLLKQIESEIQWNYENGLITGRTVDGKFIVDYNVKLDEGTLNKYREDYGDDGKAITNMISRYLVRMMQSDIELDKLFIGDRAFKQMDEKKGSVDDDRIKRLSGLLSTGDVVNNESEEYGVLGSTYTVATMYTQKVNLEKLYKENVYDNLFNNMLDIYVKDFSKVPGFEDLASKKKSEKLEILKQKFGINLNELLKGFKEIDSTDGQAWISPDMYRKLSIRMGDWSPEKDKAFKLLQSDEKLTKEEYTESMGVVMQPLKIISYGLQDEGQLEIPIYDKMSMATIFRQMGIFGSPNSRIELMDLLDRMESKGKYEGLTPINMIKMNTVAKTSNRIGFNFYTDSSRTTVNDFSNIPVFEQQYDLSRRQLVTDPHDLSRTKTGTQMIKIGMANILKDEIVYDNPIFSEIKDKSKISGNELIEIILRSLGELSNKGVDKLKQRLGITNGIIDRVKLVDMLKKDSIKSGTADLIVDAFRMDGDEMYLELDSFPNRKQIFSRIISMFAKEAIDIKLPGNQFIQMSNNGIRVGYDSELKWNYVENSKIVEMECYVSINLFKHVIPNYQNLTFEQKRKFILDNADSIMGYRIPTQGQNSVFVMKVKDVFPETIGDVISLPAPFTKLTGSDFDIDKVYLIRYNYTIVNNKPHKVGFYNTLEEVWTNEREIRYKNIYKIFDKLNSIEGEDFTKVATQDGIIKMTEFLSSVIDSEIMPDAEKEELLYNIRINSYNDIFDQESYSKLKKGVGDKIEERKQTFLDKHNGETNPYKFNSRAAVENLLIDAYKSVLLNINHITQTQIPLGSMVEKIKNLAREVNSIDGVRNYYDLDGSTPRRQAQIKFEYTGGKDGIGPFALNNVHHILTQIANVSMKISSDGLLMEDSKGHISLSEIKGKDNFNITAWLDALIDVHVDVAKDPFVMWLNINSATYDTIAVLIRGGFGIDTFKFISQPILKEYASLLLNSGKGGKITRFDSKEDVVEYIKKKWRDKLGTSEYTPTFKNTLMESNELMSNIQTQFTKENDPLYISKQLDYLDAYLTLSKAGKALNELVQASQLDTKKFGNTITQIINFKNRIKKLYDSDLFTNLDGLFAIQDPTKTTFLGPYYHNFLDFTLDTMSDLTIYSTPIFNEILNEILRLTKNSYNGDKKLIDSVSDEVMGAIFSEFFNDEDWIGINHEKLPVIFNTITDIITDIKYSKNPEYRELLENNSLLKILNKAPITIEEALPFDSFLVVPNKNFKDKFSSDSLMYSWRDLFEHPDKKIQNLARLLLYYSYVTSGFKNRLYSFHNYLPPSVLKEFNYIDPKTRESKPISFNEFIKVKRDLLADRDNMPMFSYLIDEVIINNWSKYNIVPRISYNDRLKLDIYEIDGQKTDGLTAIVVRKWDNRIGFNSKNQPVYTKYLTTNVREAGIWNTYLLKYVGTVNETKKNKTVIYPVYKTISKKSYDKKGVVIKEFQFEKSIIPSNNIKSIPDGRELTTFLNRSNIELRPIFKTFEPVDDYQTIINKNEITRNILTGDVVEEKMEGVIRQAESLDFTKGKQNIGGNISSYSSGLEFALTNPTHTSPTGYKWTDRFNDSAEEWRKYLEPGIEYEGEKFADVEEAYQSHKIGMDNNEKLELMLDLITTKLRTYPRLIEEIDKKGGLQYLTDSTHQPTNRSGFWETSGQNGFIKALTQAYLDLMREQVNEGMISTPKSSTNINDLILPEINFITSKYGGYPGRTKENAGADATIAIATNFDSAGEKLTKKSVEEQNKKYVAVSANSLEVTEERVNKIISALKEVKSYELAPDGRKGITLNIAGNGIYTLKGKYTQKEVDDFTYNLLKAVVESPFFYNTMYIKSIVTGGQTGFDEAGAKAGQRLGFPTTVNSPAGWLFRDVSGADISNEFRFKERFALGMKQTSPVQLNLFTTINDQSNIDDNVATEEFPFIEDDKTTFSTSNKEVYDLVSTLGITNWADVTPDQWKQLKEKYSHCK